MERCTRTLRITDRANSLALFDLMEKTKSLARIDVMRAIAEKMTPGKYVLEMTESTRPDPETRSTEIRCVVEFAKVDQE